MELEPRVIYLDEYLVAFNKPAGLLSVPGRRPEHQDSLALRALDRWPEARVVHRLDCETSGIMVMALNPETHRQLNRLFHDRQVKKTYVAVCHGLMEQDEGEINLPLIADWPNRPRQMVDQENGKQALTVYKVSERHDHVTRVHLFPVTGRSHQLRVHMKELGHPILGDTLYAPPQIRDAAPRLLLHAACLAFTHPATGRDLALECPPEF